MTEICLPATLRHAKNSFRYLDNTGISRSAFGGGTQTTGYGGDRVGATIDFTPHGGNTSVEKRYRAQMMAALMRTLGKQNRIFIEDNSNPRQGSFPAVELLANTDFSGTTSWLSTGKYGLTAADGALRATVIRAGINGYAAYQSATYTQFAPYATRVLVRSGRGSFTSLFPLLDNNTGTMLTSGVGYGVYGAIAQSTGAQAGLYDSATTGNISGDFFDLLFASTSRCVLSDSGLNQLLQSDALNTGANWTTTANNTIGANSATVAPDGTATAETIVESNSVNGQHYASQAVTVTSAVQDICFTVAVKTSARSWAAVAIGEGTGGTIAVMYINLASGALGTVSNGANWSNARATIVSLGDDWYQCSIVARKTNAATSVSCTVFSSTADNSLSYAGTNTVIACLIWRATMSLSGVPVRLSQTTTAAITTATQSGSAIHVKGLPVSTSGLLLDGDWVEIDGQLKMVQGSLNSDASGMGYLRFSPPLRRAISDNTPIIVHKPMGRFIVPSVAGWNNTPGVFSDASIELEEAWS